MISAGAAEQPGVVWWGFGQSTNQFIGDADDTNASTLPPTGLLMNLLTVRKWQGCIDPGTGLPCFTYANFKIIVPASWGGTANVSKITYAAWYDQNRTGAGLNDTPGANYNHVIEGDPATGLVAQRWPPPGPDSELEVAPSLPCTLNVTASCVSIISKGTLLFRTVFSPGPQMRWAPGPSPGNQSLRPMTWDFDVILTFKNGTAVSMRDFSGLAARWEFGIYRRTALSVSGGISLGGSPSVPPGSVIMADGIGIVGSSNARHRLTFHAPIAISESNDTIPLEAWGAWNGPNHTAVDPDPVTGVSHLLGGPTAYEPAPPTGNGFTAGFGLSLRVPLGQPGGSYRGAVIYRLETATSDGATPGPYGPARPNAGANILLNVTPTRLHIEVLEAPKELKTDDRILVRFTNVLAPIPSARLSARSEDPSLATVGTPVDLGNATWSLDIARGRESGGLVTLNLTAERSGFITGHREILIYVPRDTDPAGASSELVQASAMLLVLVLALGLAVVAYFAGRRAGSRRVAEGSAVSKESQTRTNGSPVRESAARRAAERRKRG